jgi:hypothetical protein
MDSHESAIVGATDDVNSSVKPNQLCSVCQDALSCSQILSGGEGTETFEHHESCTALAKSADNECHLFSILLSTSVRNTNRDWYSRNFGIRSRDQAVGLASPDKNLGHTEAEGQKNWSSNLISERCARYNSVAPSWGCRGFACYLGLWRTSLANIAGQCQFKCSYCVWCHFRASRHVGSTLSVKPSCLIQLCQLDFWIFRLSIQTTTHNFVSPKTFWVI